LKLIKASNKYLEVKKICEEIKRLNNKGIALDEIGIIVGNISKYKDILLKTFKEERIPSTLDEEIKLIDIPLIREFTNIIKLKLNNYDKDTFVKVLKSGYMDICEGYSSDKFEYILRKLKMKNIKIEYKKVFEQEKKKLRYLINNNVDKKESFEDKLEDIVNLEYIIDTLITQTSKLSNKENIKNIIKNVKEILRYYDFEKTIKDMYEGEEYSLLYRDITAYSALMKILDKVISITEIIYEDDDITLKDFYNILVRLFNDEIIKVTIGNGKGVKILTPSTARGMEFSDVFIMGLIQGEYPNLINNSWFFREEDYQLFKNIGVDIKNYKQRLDKESLLFSVALTRAKERLTLSYAESTNGENVNIASIFLDEFLNLFKDYIIIRKVKMC